MNIPFSVLPIGRRWWLALAWSTFGTLAAQVDLPSASLAAPPAAPPVRHVAYFPPDPPPLGAPLPVANAGGDPAATAPARLGAFVNEPFYALLGTRLARHDLSPEQQRHIAAYRDAKTALQTELHAHLDALKDADAPTRLRALESFALEQTPRIAELEKDADQLRELLRQGESGDQAIDRTRGSRVVPGAAEQPQVATPASEYPVMRAAVFYHVGLSPEQRRLLREVAMELEAAVKSPPTTAHDQPVFFSPDTARIRLPQDLSPELAAKVAAYQSGKSALKRELCAALSEPEQTDLASPRALQALADRQTPRIDALEKLAEEIRRELALRPDLPQALSRLALPPLTPELEARVTAYRRDKLDLQKALLARVDEVTKNSLPPRASGEKSKSGPGSPGGQRDDKIRQTIAAFTQENAARYAALEKSKEALRSDLARLASTGTIVVKGPYADVLSKNFSEALQQLETWRSYRNYQIAVFEPGLSPEQRRLLFDLALEKLSLPLPAGEIPPPGDRR